MNKICTKKDRGLGLLPLHSALFALISHKLIQTLVPSVREHMDIFLFFSFFFYKTRVYHHSLVPHQQRLHVTGLAVWSSWAWQRSRKWKRRMEGWSGGSWEGCTETHTGILLFTAAGVRVRAGGGWGGVRWGGWRELVRRFEKKKKKQEQVQRWEDQHMDSSQWIKQPIRRRSLRWAQ